MPAARSTRSGRGGDAQCLVVEGGLKSPVVLLQGLGQLFDLTVLTPLPPAACRVAEGADSNEVTIRELPAVELLTSLDGHGPALAVRGHGGDEWQGHTHVSDKDVVFDVPQPDLDVSDRQGAVVVKLDRHCLPTELLYFRYDRMTSHADMADNAACAGLLGAGRSSVRSALLL